MEKRYLAPLIQNLCFHIHKMAFVSGPRQCGKTTMAKMMIKEKGDGKYYNWDEVEFRRLWTKSPGQTIPKLNGEKIPLIVFDEIHKAKQWKRTLKGIFDTLDQSVNILVTGSARLNVYKKGSDSLLGRYYHFRLHPFTLSEMQRRKIHFPDNLIEQIFSKSIETPRHSQKDLDVLLTFGGFPEPLFLQSSQHARLWRKGRLEKIIREDLRDLSRIPELSQIEMLASLLPERCSSPLSRVSLKEILEVSFDTIHRWLSCLSELYYFFEIKPYQKSISRTLKKEGKIYLWDYSEVKNPGPRFENFVACHLLKFCHYWTDAGEGDFELYYLRNKEKEEIDFLICKNKDPWLPIEVKLNETAPSPHWKKFLKQLPCQQGIQIIHQPNYWKEYPVENKKILIASACDILSYFI